MTNFERLKAALKKQEEERFKALKAEIKKMQASIERFLELALESTSNRSRTNYSGLDMY